jgi:hypothetical protein
MLIKSALKSWLSYGKTHENQMPSHKSNRMDTINLTIVLLRDFKRHTLLCRQRIHCHTEYSSIKQKTLTRLSYTMTLLGSNGGFHVQMEIYANGTHALGQPSLVTSQK